MKMRRSFLGLLAFAVIMVVADATYASCLGSNRVYHRSAECLHGWWDNNDWPHLHKFGVQGSCQEWGTVVAKIDLTGCSDRTWHLNNNNKRRGSSTCRVRSIFCCKDVGDLCNHEDVVTIAGCTSQWNKSPASDTCKLSGGETYTGGGSTHEENLASVTWSGENCSFWAKCEYTADDGTTKEKQTNIADVHWLDADEVENCDGELKEKNSC